MPLHKDIAELIEWQSRDQPDFEVLTFVDVDPAGDFTDQKRSYRQLIENGRRLALWLQSRGVGPGDRFAIMLQNHPEFVEAMVAASLLGAVFVPIDPRSVGQKLSYMLNFVECCVVIAGDYALGALFAIKAELEHAKDILLVGNISGQHNTKLTISHYEDGLPRAVDHLDIFATDPATPMFMMFTSGTTGNPKAVVRSHASYMRGVKGLRPLGVEEDDTLYTGLPLCHINAHSTLSMGLSTGIPVVISRRFTKSNLWEICRRYGCTVITLLGGMIPEIFAVPQTDKDADNPVRLIISSGMPERLWREYEQRFGVVITEVYGSTEAGGVLVNCMGEGPVGSMGKPLKGTLAGVLDDNGIPCAPFEPGELCFRPAEGKAGHITYFRNQKASDDKVLGGWFRSGDIAHMDGDGWFYFHHRAGGGVRRNGDFINTALVETILAQSPDVDDIFVYGVPTRDNVAGERILVAAVVMRQDGALDAVKNWAASKLQKNDIPEIWQVLPAIPKTISEKPVERDCIALLKQAGLADVIA